MRRDIPFRVRGLAAAFRRAATPGLLAVLVTACGFFLAGFASAQTPSYKVEKSSAPPPTELSAAVRDALAPDELRVNAANGVFCEIWLRKSVSPAASPAKEFGVTFGQIPEGTLVAALRLSHETQDYRNQTIPAGVYTLRYALIPVDGNHLGIAAQRDFLLLGPATKDSDPAALTRDQTLDLSRAASGTGHPSVWSLGPPDSGAGTLPSVAHQQGNDTWALAFNLNVAGGTVPMALVIVGHAPDI
jgi:hypothetical protein